MKLSAVRVRPVIMFFDPRALFMMVVLVGVTGWVLRSLMVTWHRLNKADEPAADRMRDMEDRMRKLESATSSLLVDVTGMREKQRFMARLQAEPSPQPQAEKKGEGELSPMVIQSMPVIPRARSPRV